MRVTTIIGAQSAYACIHYQGLALDVRLAAGRSAADSLRETAEEWREEARRLQHRANILSVAASKLDEDLERGRRFSSRSTT